ncbi:hypothetical protein ACFY36_28340 [Actinoplanes sp. NPDC000266]
MTRGGALALPLAMPRFRSAPVLVLSAIVPLLGAALILFTP